MTLAYNTRSREEADLLMGEAKAAGAAVLRAPHEAPWGGYVGYFADPDGHPWEVTYAPTLVPQADGSIVLP
ncbi:VOC family protein [Aureimonas populi]|uniref:VOC family protein n=2 Tax=Aureimonas populi TaxID=1701758 RepID=A0ABW5CKC6_9HYPH|nr:VOC family protein [Aureimonas populi]